MLTLIKKYMSPAHHENPVLLRPYLFLFIILCAISTIIATSILLYNHWVTHYHPQSFYIPNIWRQGIEGVLFYIGSYTLSARFKRISIMLRSAGIFFIMIFFFALLNIAISTTPQTTTIDIALSHADQWLGYNTMSVLQWLNQHQAIARTLAHFYNLYSIEVFWLTVPLMCLFCYDVEVVRAMNVALLASIIGLMIYYIWPSTGPAVIYKTHYFATTGLYDTYASFMQLHQHSQHIIDPTFGLISFPSFHVLGALFILYLFFRIKWVFYPLLACNIVLFFSTFLLGIHFLVDSLASLVIFFACVALHRMIIRMIA